MNIHLDDYQARQVGWSLSLLCQWLHQADEQVLDQLADVGFDRRTQPRQHRQRLLDELEAHAAVLGQRRAASAAPGGAR